jgi:hypothetical protein
MTTKIDIDVLTDLLIEKNKRDQQIKDENDRLLRIESPNSYDYNSVITQEEKKEPKRVIIIDI